MEEDIRDLVQALKGDEEINQEALMHVLEEMARRLFELQQRVNRIEDPRS